MKTKIPFQIGDSIIHHGQSLVVKDIVDKQNLEGSTEPHLVCEPEFVSENQPMLKYTIPVSSLADTNIRQPIDESKLQKVWSALEHTPSSDRAPGAIQGREILKENNVVKTARLIKQLYHEKHQPDRKLPISKNTVLRSALKSLRQEVATTLHISPDEAEEKILKRINATLTINRKESNEP